MRKYFIVLLIIALLLPNTSGIIAYAVEDKESVAEQQNDHKKNVDVTPPELKLDTLKVSKNEAKVGDLIEISLEATDDISGIKEISVAYEMPLSGKYHLVYLAYNEKTNRYVGTIQIDSNTEPGKWEVLRIALTDNDNNRKEMWYTDYEFKSLSFNVQNSNTVDITPPELKLDSMKVSKNEAAVGDLIEISLEATDDISGIKEISVAYETPLSGKYHFVFLTYNEKMNRYVGTIQTDLNTELGKWEVLRVALTDNKNNRKEMWNRDYDFSPLSFTVLKGEDFVPLEDVTAITSNTSWSNKTINGDVYIGPNAVLTINGNVQVNGNIYVLGALKSYGGLKVNESLYGKSMSFGGNLTLYNGTVVLSGSNSISSTNMSNHPVQDIPVRIDNKLEAINGKLDIKGTTIDVADMYIENQKVELDYLGRFKVLNLNIGSKKSIEIQFKTVFGNTITKSFQVKNSLNSEPVISASDLVINMGTSFNPLVGVSAIDEEDGEITSKIEVVENTVDTKNAGQYKVTYQVTDSQKATVTKTIKVVVKDVTAPVVTGVTNKGIYKSSVTIRFNEGKATLNGKAFTSGTEVKAEGTYELVVTDEAGNVTKLSFTIDMTTPVVTGVTNEGKYNASVTIRFNEGKATLNGKSFTSGTEVKDEGTYKLIVTDLAGNQTIVNFVIEKKETPSIVFKDVSTQYTFYEEINYLVNRSIISGYPDGTFKPGKSVTRAEAAIMIGRALGFDGKQTVTSFPDVSSSSVASGYIQAAVNAGIIQGFPDGTYRPSEPVTRGQLAIFLSRGFELTETTTVTFKDVSKTSAAYEYIGRLVAANITLGYEDNTFRPNEAVTRGQFSAFLTRTLKYVDR
ncbi:S-layer homology domain-containing protein [Bacillus massiliigorillae]|uniref:S-layer homology domain-containing protein n=1 Tax=Bacillus massiliigorillae TaxID=1243664 RepID=UPI0003A704AA|nr:S-layer homology domain-containing protein [Bacillus massiliigorillae]